MTGTVQIAPRALDALEREAAEAAPGECCGLLAGRDGRVEEIYPVPNVAAAPESRYEMSPAEMWAARRLAADARLEVVGFYHSHPRTPPSPSSYDIERAYYPDAVYLIVGVEPRPEIRAFRIAGGTVREIEIVRSCQKPCEPELV